MNSFELGCGPTVGLKSICKQSTGSVQWMAFSDTEVGGPELADPKFGDALVN